MGRLKKFYYLWVTRYYSYEILRMSLIVRAFMHHYRHETITHTHRNTHAHWKTDRQHHKWLLFVEITSFKAIIMSCLFWTANGANRNTSCACCEPALSFSNHTKHTAPSFLPSYNLYFDWIVYYILHCIPCAFSHSLLMMCYGCVSINKLTPICTNPRVHFTKCKHLTRV